MTISFVILLVHLSISEMKNSWINRLQTISLLSTFVLLWGALILKTGIDGTAYDVVVGLFLWAPLILIFVVVSQSTFQFVFSFLIVVPISVLI